MANESSALAGGLPEDYTIICDAGGGTVDVVGYELNPQDLATASPSLAPPFLDSWSLAAAITTEHVRTTLMATRPTLPVLDLSSLKAWWQRKWRTQSQIRKPSSPWAVYEIPCVVGSTCLNALGDYCAKSNFMREDYAIGSGYIIDRTSSSTITIGSGKTIATVGTITVPLRFDKEHANYMLQFHLLRDCIHDVILGKQFLRATETFSSAVNRMRRVKQRVLESLKSYDLLYLGDGAPRFMGYVDGYYQEALADSGAKVMIMDEDFARSIGQTIDRGMDSRIRLRFADGSTAKTSGMVYGVPWHFGYSRAVSDYKLDFHILKNAPANVILSDEFLFGTNAFSEYDCYLVDDDDEDEDGYFFAIDIDMNYYHQDQGNNGPEHAELIRRGRADDDIDNLPQAQQAEARSLETLRRTQWDAWRTSTLQPPSSFSVSGAQNPSIIGLQHSSSLGIRPSSTSGTQSTNTPTPSPLSPPHHKSRRWRFKLKLKRKKTP